MPGGDQSPRPASLDQTRGGSPGSPGYTTQIEGGLMAGGYSTSPGGDLGTDGAGGYSYGRGGAGGRGPASVGMDLKKYLPGQRLDPRRRMGGDAMLSAEINGKSCDMFKKISARFQEKCKLGVLLGCH
jgi:hypothetical protein